VYFYFQCQRAWPASKPSFSQQEKTFPDHSAETAKQLYSTMAKLAAEVIASDDCTASGYLKSQETTEP